MDVEVDKRHDASFSDRPSGVVTVVVSLCSPEGFLPPDVFPASYVNCKQGKIT